MDTIKLNAATGKLYISVTLDVASANFRAVTPGKLFQSASGYKGIAYRYYDIVNNTADNGTGYPMTVTFELDNTYKWKVGDSVRIMSLNEDTQTNFDNLSTYFTQRLEYLQDGVCTQEDLEEINFQWNSRAANANAPVINYPELYSGSPTAGNYAIDDSIKVVAEPAAHVQPRLTKKDTMLFIIAFK
ncbi:hypothetical protein ACLI1A_02195 [Flavobacterium sp. RHBU_3]|uniref:hypothetical protein n=1 Tax=Flavobacterium sp. RHBU_3 TaxID=3391184 RepID=UPI0039850A50